MNDFLYITDTDEKSVAHIKQQNDRVLSWQLRMREWLELNKLSVNTSVQMVTSIIQQTYPQMINDPDPLSSGYYEREAAPSIESNPKRTLMACLRDWWRYQQLVKQAATKLPRKTLLDFHTVTFHNIKTHHLTVLMIDSVTEILPVFGLEMKSVIITAAPHKSKEKEEEDDYTSTRKQFYQKTMEWIRVSSHLQQFPVISVPSTSPMLMTKENEYTEPLEVHEPIESFAFAKEPSELYTRILSLVQHITDRTSAWRSNESAQLRQTVAVKSNDALAAEQKASTALAHFILSTHQQHSHMQRVTHELSEVSQLIACVEQMERQGTKSFPTTLIHQITHCKELLDQTHSELQDDQLKLIISAHQRESISPLWSTFKQAHLGSFMWKWLQLRIHELDTAIMIQRTVPDWDKTYSHHLGRAELFQQREIWEKKRADPITDSLLSYPKWKTSTLDLIDTYNTFVTKTLVGQYQQLKQERSALLSKLGCMFGTKDPFTKFNDQRFYAFINHHKAKLSSLRLQKLHGDSELVVGVLLNTIMSHEPTHPHVFLDRVVLIVTLIHDN